MTWIDHWPVLAAVVQVTLGTWMNAKIKRAQQPLEDGEIGTRGRDVLRKFANNKPAMRTAAGMFLIVYVCVLVPWFMEMSFGITYENAVKGMNRLPPAWFEWLGYQKPKYAPWMNLCGTDHHGRDILVRVLIGGRISLLVGSIAAIVSLVAGTTVGAASGYIGRWFDTVVMRIVDMLLMIPATLLIMLLMSFYGHNVYILIVGICLTSWLALARLVRGEVLALKHMEFVEAAVACGTPTATIIFRHVLINTLGVAMVNTTLSVPRIMLQEAIYSYLGFGIRPPLASWGMLQSNGIQDVRYYPWMVIFPAITMTLTLYFLNYFGEGVRDALDPNVQGFTGRKSTGATRKILGDIAQIFLGNWSWEQIKERFSPTEEAGPTQMQDEKHVLEIAGLRVEFDTGERSVVKAVNGVSLALGRGEVLTVVGESGSGKSVTFRALLRLNETGIITGGSMRMPGIDLLRASRRMMYQVLGKRIAMVFQDAMSALNPFLTVRTQLIEAIQVHDKVSRREAWDRSVAMLRRLDISDPEECMKQYPHELSGGMRQRAMIAMALLQNPDVLILDEPTTALDVTIQAQILNLLRQLKREMQTAIIFITHDLGIVGEVADRVAVMYAGRIIEHGSVKDVLEHPEHPYTQGLLASHPPLTGERKELESITGEPPDLRGLPPGCAFEPRCPLKFKHEGCRAAFPPERQYSETHAARCVKLEVVP